MGSVVHNSHASWLFLLVQEHANSFSSDHHGGLGRHRQRGLWSHSLSFDLLWADDDLTRWWRLSLGLPVSSFCTFTFQPHSCLSLMSFANVLFHNASQAIGDTRRRIPCLSVMYEVTTFAILNVMIAVIVESTLDEAHKRKRSFSK